MGWLGLIKRDVVDVVDSVCLFMLSLWHLPNTRTFFEAAFLPLSLDKLTSSKIADLSSRNDGKFTHTIKYIEK